MAFKGNLAGVVNLRKEWEEKLNASYRRRVRDYMYPSDPSKDQNDEALGQEGISVEWLHSRAHRNRALLETHRQVEQEREKRQAELTAKETQARMRMETALKSRVRRHEEAQERLRQHAEESWAREKELQLERQITREQEHRLCIEREQMRSERREKQVDHELFSELQAENQALHNANTHMHRAAAARVCEVQGLDEVIARKREMAHGAHVDLKMFEKDMSIQEENDALEAENARMREVLEQIRQNDMRLAFK